MVSEIQPANNFINNYFQSLKNSVSDFYFSDNNAVSKPDEFDKRSDKPKSKFNYTMLTVTGACVAILALTRARLGKILKLVGEKVPLTIIGRVIKVLRIASTDGMTGLLNKQALLATLSKDCKKAVNHKKNYSLAMLDMDNFKAFNELFSHEDGDVVLKRVAANIQKITQKYKIKGFRYGGEEFVVALPKHDAESAKKIIEEIADEIKNDVIIQGLMPRFLEKAKADIDFISPKISQMYSIFLKLREGSNIGNYKKLSHEIISLIEVHIDKYHPADAKAFNEIIAKLKDSNENTLTHILKINTKLNDGSTIGTELDKIYTQYKETINDLQKWINHVNKHKFFTISGGLVNIIDSSKIKDGISLLEIADTALKSAKENRKNIIVRADNDLIEKALEKNNKKKL